MGGGLPPPYPPPLDPFAGQMPKNDQGHDPNRHIVKVDVYTCFKRRPGPLWDPFGTFPDQGCDPDRIWALK